MTGHFIFEHVFRKRALYKRGGFLLFVALFIAILLFGILAGEMDLMLIEGGTL